MTIRKEELDALRARVAGVLSPYRMAHTLGVEEMAARLAALYAPDKADLLRAAALLHDVTKEKEDAAQLALLADAGITLRPDEAAAPQIWHAITAPLAIVRDYPAFALPPLLSAVRWHTTGRADMTLEEAILYLADMIEEGRRFPDCVALRNAFWQADPAAMPREARIAHLRSVLLLSFDTTIEKLRKSGREASLDTAAARQYLALQAPAW